MRKSVRFAEFVLLSLVSSRCMPDLDALQAGSDGGSASCTEGDCTGGTSNTGGSNETGGKGGKGGTTASGGDGGGGTTAKGGSTSSGGNQAGGIGGEQGGAGGNPDATGGTAGSGGEGASTPTEGGTGSGGEPSGGAGGGGTQDPCKLPSDVYTGFDTKALGGPGILPTGTETYISSAFTDSRKANGVVEWSESEGKTCPGAFKLTANFFEYSSKPEIVNGMLDFPADFTGARILHLSMKVENPGPYLGSFQPFISSGDSYQYYRSNYQNGSVLADGAWHEFTLSLAPSMVQYDSFEPTTVKQIGIQLLLSPTAPTGGPATPPSIVAYMDDIWVEF